MQRNFQAEKGDVLEASAFRSAGGAAVTRSMITAIAAHLSKTAGNRNDHTLRLEQGLRAYGLQNTKSARLGPLSIAIAAIGAIPPTLLVERSHAFAFSGRLYNRDEIAARLGKLAGGHDSLTDAEIAWRSWLGEGINSLRSWVGSFAFIAFDNDAKVLTAARDHLGLSPLHYHDNAERIVLASSAKILFAQPDIPRQVDEQKIADQLVQLFHDGARSYHHGINRILPAHLLQVTGDHTTSERYWSLADAPSIQYRNDNEYLEQGAALFEQAVRAQIRPGDRVGAFLSGGLDSSSVAVSALGHLPSDQKLKTFTWIPSREWRGTSRPGHYGDESPFVREIAAAFPRIDPQFLRSEGHGLYHRLDEFMDKAGVAPRNAINLCWIHDIHEAARETGLTVLLQGSLGNMTLSWNGAGVLMEHWQKGRYRSFFRDLLAGSSGAKNLAKRFLHGFAFPMLPDAAYDAWQALRRGRLRREPPWRRRSAINPQFAAEMDMQARMQGFGWDFYERPMRNPRALREEALTTSFFHELADIDQAFRVMYGIEARDPFSDRRLIEWCIGVPENQYYRAGASRWLMRRIMAGRLPPKVLDNKAVGEQVIDWPVRLNWDVDRIREDLAIFADDPDIRRYLDLDLIRAYLDKWSPEHPPSIGERGYAFLPVSIGSALAAARFVRMAKGANQ